MGAKWIGGVYLRVLLVGAPAPLWSFHCAAEVTVLARLRAQVDAAENGASGELLLGNNRGRREGSLRLCGRVHDGLGKAGGAVSRSSVALWVVCSGGGR